MYAQAQPTRPGARAGRNLLYKGVPWDEVGKMTVPGTSLAHACDPLARTEKHAMLRVWRVESRSMRWTCVGLCCYVTRATIIIKMMMGPVRQGIVSGG